jgi:hypothetical protein
VLYVNFEGLHLDTAEQARELATYVDQRLATLGHRVHAVVNYDNLELGPTAEETFFTMIRDGHRKALPQRDALLHERLLPPPARRALHRGAARPDHPSDVRSGPGRNP